MTETKEVIICHMAGFEILREIFQEDIRRCCSEALGAAMWAKIARRISAIVGNEEPKTTVAVGDIAYQRMAVGLTEEGKVTHIAMVVTLNRDTEHSPGGSAWDKDDKK